MRNIHPSPLLKGALTADALVSGAVAALQLLGGQSLASWLALPQPLLTAAGAFLVAYAFALLVMARSTSIGSLLIWVVVLGNVGWASACIALLAIGSLATGSLGTAFVLVQAAAVLVFAVLEYKGMRSSAPIDSLESGFARSAAAR
jgi:hypothetical protein